MFIFGFSSLSVQGASSIAQGFQTNDDHIIAGALVSLKNGEPNSIELSNPENVDRLLGIVGENSAIELSTGSDKVQVVTSGETKALVSDINGEIKTGDKITSSPLSGIGMKAASSTIVIGTAQADFADISTEASTIKDKDGKAQTVHIGAMLIQVDKVFYESPEDAAGSFIPGAVKDFASNIAGHKVSSVRIVVAGLLVLLLFAVIAILLYSAVHSSIISIGRNPLAEAGVRKSLIEVGLTVVGILVFTVIVIYLVLTT